MFLKIGGDLILRDDRHGLRRLVIAEHGRSLGELIAYRRYLLPQAVVPMTLVRTFLRAEGFEHRLEGLFIQRV